MKNKILLIGAGGHCRVVLDLLLQSKEYRVAGLVDVKAGVGQNVLGIPVIGTDQDLPKLFKKGIKHCFIAVGSVGDPAVRIKLAVLARKTGFLFPNLIHPTAVMSSRVRLGQGNYIAPGVIINAGADIGDHCIINTGVILDHDCKLGDFVHVAPGSVLSGGVIIGNNSHIGTGATVVQEVKIGANTVIGVGSVVTKNIPSGVIAYGSPCKERKHG
jgi:sugar O-acyltransferase (sialic acid O-acetyltransferase NeuD family)